MHVYHHAQFECHIVQEITCIIDLLQVKISQVLL